MATLLPTIFFEDKLESTSIDVTRYERPSSRITPSLFNILHTHRPALAQSESRLIPIPRFYGLRSQPQPCLLVVLRLFSLLKSFTVGLYDLGFPSPYFSIDFLGLHFPIGNEHRSLPQTP